MQRLRGVLEGWGALMAGLIILEPLGQTKERNFHREMAKAGHLEAKGRLFPRMLLLTVAEIFEGKTFDTPYSLWLGRKEHKQQIKLDLPSKTICTRYHYNLLRSQASPYLAIPLWKATPEALSAP